MDELEGKGFKVLLPREVMQELKDLRTRVSHDERVAIDLAFVVFDKKKMHKIRLGTQKVDEGLIEKGKQGYYIATLDAEIKRSVPNRVVIANSKNSIEIERD